MLVGTVAYLPPEQALGRSSDARSDLYSLGAMLYELLTGEPPFPGEDAVAIIGQHLNAQPVAPSRHRPEITPALDGLVLRLLAKRPDDRPQSAAEARREIEAAADAAPEPPAPEAPENPLEGLAGGVFVGRDAELEQMRAELEDALAGRRAAAAGLRRSRDRQDADGRAARDLRPGPRRPRLLGTLPRGRGPAPVLAVVGGAALVRPRRRPGRAALGARQPGRRRRPDRPRDRRPARRRRRAARHGDRAGALPALRLVRRLPRRRLERPAAGDRARRPALGRRALAAPAALRRPPARGHRTCC